LANCFRTTRWPTLSKDVEQWVKSCKTCQEHSNPHRPTAARHQPIKTIQALEKMGMDLIGPLPKRKKGQVYALVMQDYFTKWPEAIPLKDATTKSVAGALLSVISMWGPLELLRDQGPVFMAELNCELSRQWGIKRQYEMAYHPQTNGQVEQFNRTLKTMIAKFVNGRQDNWDIYLPAFLYAYRTSPHKSTGHTPYKAMLGRAPPSKDGVATESIPMDEWVQELCVAQEEARKLSSANIESEQQDQVESTPHWSRTWEAGDQVMLQADHKGKGQLKKFSKKWAGPYTIIEVCSPQVVVLEEPNSRNWLTVNIERIKPFNAATLTALNSTSNDGHYKVEEVLEERTMGTGRCEYKVKWVGYTNRHNSWVAEEDLHANSLLEQFQASRSSVTMDGVWNPRNTADGVQAGRGR